MVDSGAQERLTFTAPKEVGEYPYVCTFPRHWMRMYGVMIVVNDLDAWLRNPVPPKDPIGSQRPFVKSWTLDDFKGELKQASKADAELGQRLFREATCAECHKVQGKGGAVGPELTKVFERWKGDRAGVLREILEPSHRVDPKYAVRLIYTTRGQVITGLVASEDKTSVSIIENPEDPKPRKLKRSRIAEMIQTSKSLMPKALLDRFTKEEVLQILLYLESLR